jgi:hypothetical protein
MLYFGLSKNNKIIKKTKSSFLCTHTWQNLDLSFLPSPKYIIFRSKKLHTDKIQHYLHHGIFSRFCKDLNSIFWSFKIWAPWRPSSKCPHLYVKDYFSFVWSQKRCGDLWYQTIVMPFWIATFCYFVELKSGNCFMIFL